MPKRLLQRFALFMGVAGCLLAGTYGLWLREQHQHALNRQLIAALEQNNPQQALLLVNEGADPNTPHILLPPPTFHELWDHLFHNSALPANDSPTALLIACGAPWGETTEDLKAMDQETPQLVEAMLVHGGNPNAAGRDGLSPLQLAIWNRHPQTARVLIEHKANCNPTSTASFSPLVLAARFDNFDTLRLLLEHGADANCKDSGGQTLLTQEVWANDSQKVRLLLEHGAHLDGTTSDGQTLLTGAAWMSDVDTVRLLLEHGADVNAKDDNGQLPLINALANGNPSTMLHLLLEHGANPALINKHGETALQIAQQSHRPDLIAVLRQAKAKK